MSTPTISILGCGWLGLPLGSYLAQHGWCVNGSSTSPDKSPRLESAGIRPHIFTLSASGIEGKVDRFFQADVLFLNVPPVRGSEQVLATVIGQTKAVLEAARAAGLGWIIYASSTSVYADVCRVVTESDAAHGEASRKSGEALRAAERMLLDAAAPAATVLRFAGLYGPGRPPGRFFAGRTDVAGAYAPVNLVHLDDCIGAVKAVLDRQAKGEVFNVCAPAHPVRRVFYSAAARALGKRPPSFKDESIGYKIVNSGMLRDELGYRFEHPDPLADVMYGT